MITVHPFRFGASIQATSRSTLVEQVRKAEDLGYSSLIVTDHLSKPRLSPIALAASVATLSSNVWIGIHVLGNDFRHPAVLAGEAATIDIISEGRLEFGIGTGWMGTDYEQSGIVLDSPGTRVSRLIEAVQIYKGLFADEPLTFSGDYYQIKDLNINPKSIQRPHPRIFIGGSGRRMLSLAAREADIIGLIPKLLAHGFIDPDELLADALAKKVTWIKQAAPERFSALELNAFLVDAIITDNQVQEAEKWLERIEEGLGHPGGLTTEDILQSPHFLIGTVTQIVEKLQLNRKKYGLSYYTIHSGFDMEILSPVVVRLAGK